jgi:hemerythrin
MEWSEDFESGLPEIDGYHRQAFALVQRVREGVDRSVMRAVLAELEQLTSDHFDFEARIMQEYAYPGTQRHVADHGSLLREIQGYRESTAYSPRRLNLVLRNWLQSHTIMEDRRLAQHVLHVRTGELRTDSRDELPPSEGTAQEALPHSGIRAKSDNVAKQASGV